MCDAFEAHADICYRSISGKGKLVSKHFPAPNHIRIRFVTLGSQGFLYKFFVA